LQAQLASFRFNLLKPQAGRLGLAAHRRHLAQRLFLLTLHGVLHQLVRAPRHLHLAAQREDLLAQLVLRQSVDARKPNAEQR
jgi:hypothetical protein